MALNRQAFLTYKAVPRVEVQVPEMGGSVWVRSLSNAERDQFELGNSKAPGVNFRAKLIVACTCAEDGVDVFELGDIAAVAQLPSAVTERIVDAALAVNKFTKTETEELGKGSGPTTGTDSPSGSPLTLA